MTWPRPVPGLVVRYSYLWDREAALGREEASKDRPCAVLLVVAPETVFVLPITHARPDDAADAVEIPPAVKRRLGLDDAQSWIVVTEVNEFRWPGPDLRAVGDGEGQVAYGMLPYRLTEKLQAAVVSLLKAGRLRRVSRTD